MAYHTPISLALGPLLAYCIFRWLKIHPAWKIGLLLVAMLLTIGVLGIVLNVGLAIALAVVLFIGSPAIWIGGLVALGLWGDFRYSELAWWKTCLIGGVWWVVSMLLDQGLKLGLLFAFTSVQQAQEKPHEQ
ncbi:MAG: hypothetical protein IPK02_18150 [Candidatus Accumulibacter sp.]|uniref:Uncharacterized protein n=1 Tax=Candidatus Accumulibacter affinis TaxID=2954384 RepID=A0A935W8B5_9PROT|nr:hypothetical protein [Candidatus Accumulibacter affinis]